LAGPDFAELYAQHFDYVCHSLRRLGIPPGALEDVAQEVFLRVHAKLDTYDAARPPRPWLFGIALREASTWRQRASQRRELPTAEPPLAVDERTPEGAAQGAQLRRQVLQALEALDEQKRAVFILHDVDGTPVPEIARALELPVNTAWSRLRSARQAFNAALAEFARPRQELR
jgi:RNA polymerase sigma-70 factor, ECF subfamily